MSIRNCICCITTLIACVFISTDSAAEIVIAFEPQVAINQGETGQLDVFIRSTAAQTDFLGIYSAKFRITPIAGGGLSFLDPPRDAHYGDSNYIFAGTTHDGLSSTVTAPNTIVAGDGTMGPAGVVEVTAENRLLVTLDFDTSQAAVGSQFQISMVDDADTDFLDDGFASLPIAAESFSNFGTVTITAIPEPSGFAALGFAVSGMTLFRRRRRNSLLI
ncbi:hypothetical protein Mal15_33160 [Stieleria maiorica]|uniref:PEP-CTERM protein-sorting domain-containing protein n=1 Tax=Stieleria maiorica TaxID=2795974 RepID=A0A5B9MHZ7_9BACT|nr:PEP-CTERM sorting domain-containing protein [Stieleria maiorica]QEF99254.1 hypothetical protein Mal15_33160 [Stieleria maiorica]